MPNQNLEQLARDQIDAELIRCGWVIQNKKQINLAAALRIAVREYQTDIGPADYVLFVNKQPVGIIEPKRSEEGADLTIYDEPMTLIYKCEKLRHTKSSGGNSPSCNNGLQSAEIQAVPGPWL